MKKEIWLIILWATLIFLGTLLYLELKPQITEDPECSNKSLIKNAQCLNLFVRNNFQYRINDDDNILTTKELIERGGDCKDWTELYERNLKKNGFANTRKEIIELKPGEGHVFLIAWDEKSYCTFDMKDYNCWRIEL